VRGSCEFGLTGELGRRKLRPPEGRRFRASVSSRDTAGCAMLRRVPPRVARDLNRSPGLEPRWRLSAAWVVRLRTGKGARTPLTSQGPTKATAPPATTHANAGSKQGKSGQMAPKILAPAAAGVHLLYLPGWRRCFARWLKGVDEATRLRRVDGLWIRGGRILCLTQASI
jgi:hypothetical protein